MDAMSTNFTIAAYAITWLCLGVYALYAHIALRNARSEHDRASRAAAGVTR